MKRFLAFVMVTALSITMGFTSVFASETNNLVSGEELTVVQSPEQKTLVTSSGFTRVSTVNFSVTPITEYAMTVNSSSTIYVDISMPNNGGLSWAQGSYTVTGTDGYKQTGSFGNYVDQSWQLSWPAKTGVSYTIVYSMHASGTNTATMTHHYYAR